jgi:hypothetical protein
MASGSHPRPLVPAAPPGHAFPRSLRGFSSVTLARTARALPALALVPLLALANGCASAGLSSAAEQGDLSALRQRIDRAKQQGKLDGGEVRDAAHETARQIVKKADKVDELDAVRMCVADLSSSLFDRTKEHDAVGARAAYLLLDDDRASTARWHDRVNDPDAAWRAVGARSLVARADGAKRRELFLDLDPRVRVGAIEAAYRALDKEDAHPLLEVVRLDPDGVARNLGARTVGAIGGREVVLALRDRWDRADEPLRAAIASSFGFTASYDDGGRDALVWIAETQSGSPGVTAGSTLFRATKDDRPIGRAALLRALGTGSTAVRVMAIQLASLDDAELRAEIEKAAGLEAKSQEADPKPADPAGEEGSTTPPTGPALDTAVKVAALGKLALRSDRRAEALAALGPLAAGEDRAANAAKVALATARDRRVVPLLVKDLSSTLPDVRAWAASILAGMHELQEAAPALADPEPTVRGRAACSIVRAPAK